MNIENWLLFSSIALIAAVTPGPAVLLVTSHAIAYGLKKAISTIFGNISGLLIMSALSVLGLSTVLFYSSTVFLVIKIVGAAYLVYLGVRLWRHGFAGSNDKKTGSEKYLNQTTGIKRYLQGLVVAISNPKAIAFTTALFPQFIEPAHDLKIQFFILVATFMLLSFICLVIYGYMAENMRSRSSSSNISARLSKFFGAAFIASGIALVGASQK